MQQQARGITGVTAEEVFIGNGVSELIDLTLRALLNDGDEVLVPSPDYPAVDRGGHPQPRPRGALPVPPGERLRARPGGGRAPGDPAHARDRHHQPQQPHRRGLPARGARGASRAWPSAHGLVVFSDEIYDQMPYDGAQFVPMATLVHDTAVRHLLRALQGVPRLRLPRRLGVLLRPHARGRRLPERARAAGLAAPVRQRPRRSGRCRPRSAATRACSS